ncbi:hypothetical protein [Asaccharospora irregularis]|uniref:Uncharacterized protein n=1 Tax=Asaccharospora irregularis DSM 2635 TaxID=1121321 RepID=A0A1M5R663_9FIRM|nr:hypothetical protein [Asaccharospora irregularis]SHH21449.1 hypothetical protein SAMN04488530_12711 [Asaccharospora irregularis DSM 2635]
MLKIKKIIDKEEINVSAQSSSCKCGSNGKPIYYLYKDKSKYYQSSCL